MGRDGEEEEEIDGVLGRDVSCRVMGTERERERERGWLI